MVDYKYTDEKWLYCRNCGEARLVFLEYGRYTAWAPCHGWETLLPPEFDPEKEGVKVEPGTKLEYLQRKYPGEQV